MTHQDRTARDAITDTRRRIFGAAIEAHGGAYILPAQNAQPDPALAIASIHLHGIIGIGPTEAQAHADWHRQAPAQAQANAARAQGARA